MKAARKQKYHHLKTWPEYFEQVITLNKRFEVRKADRDFQVGDVLVLKEYDPKKGYTGRQIAFRTTFILRDGFEGVQPGFVVMSLTYESPAEPFDDSAEVA